MCSDIPLQPSHGALVQETVLSALAKQQSAAAVYHKTYHDTWNRHDERKRHSVIPDKWAAPSSTVCISMVWVCRRLCRVCRPSSAAPRRPCAGCASARPRCRGRRSRPSAGPRPWACAACSPTSRMCALCALRSADACSVCTVLALVLSLWNAAQTPLPRSGISLIQAFSLRTPQAGSRLAFSQSGLT